MMAQVLLTLLLAIALLYAWSQYRSAPAIGILGLAIGAAGLYFVWLPQQASAVAAWMGVGRGVDMILYLWAAFSLIALLNLHLKLRAQLEIVTEIARSIALAHPQRLGDASSAPIPSDPPTGDTAVEARLTG